MLGRREGETVSMRETPSQCGRVESPGIEYFHRGSKGEPVRRAGGKIITMSSIFVISQPVIWPVV